MTCSRMGGRGSLQLILILLAVFSYSASRACQCPATSLSMQETAKYEIIFRGEVDSVKPCGARPGEAFFKVLELYKGNAEEIISVQFTCGDDCAVGFRAGEEWIIYSRYRQVNVALMDWCSRSRRFFRHEKEDFYKVNFGNDYTEELTFLRTELGLHRLLKKKDDQSGKRNRLPDLNQSILLIVASIVAIVLFYVLFKKFFR